ncbi:MAG: hypothetical protein H6R10_1393 [Rhodocyclaceae bacterium]|nr:hypothetical protein [Rhodocyclaceae bacterium]
MPSPAYEALQSLTVQLKSLSEAGDWDSAASLIAGVRLENLPRAKPEDRAAIEAALENIAAITERAIPLRDDIARMLTAFGMPPSNP